MMTFAEFQERLNQTGRYMIPELARAMQRGARLVQSWSQKHYLGGPRPQKLDEISSRLTRSIATMIEVEGTRVTALVGTNVVYGRIHELGGRTRAQRSFRPGGGKNPFMAWQSRSGRGMPARPFLSTAIRDKQKEITQMFADAGVAYLKKMLLKVI